MRALMLTLLLAGCEAEVEESHEKATVVAVPAAVHKETAEAHEQEGEDDDDEEVGPDGPSGLAVPDVGTVSTDAAVIARGEAVFSEKGCGGCHQFGTKLVGPDLNDVTERRSAVWVARMIRHPDQMTKQDPVAKELLKSHMVQMPNQGVSDTDLIPLIAYLNSKRGA